MKGLHKIKLNAGMKAVKFLLFVFNFAFLLFGLKLIIVGSILNVEFKDYLDFQGRMSISSIALFVISFGVVVTVISFFGCVGAFRESRCMILTYSTFLVITFFVELALVFIGFSFKEKMYTVIQEEMGKSINSTQPGVMKTWNIIQREFKCCGFTGPIDWQRRGSFMPNSCCETDLGCPSDENPLFMNGCNQVLTIWTNDNLSILATIALVISIFQIFGTTFSCLLAKSIKRGYEVIHFHH